MKYIHFSHANGFPAKTYSILFKFLKNYKISYIDILADKVESKDINWNVLSDEIINRVLKSNNKVIGVGHSLGGVLMLLAASKHPKLFNSVILLDPPLFSPQKRLAINIFRNMKMDDIFSPARKSKNRRDKFDTYKQALEYFKSKIFFKNFHPSAIQDYVKYGLEKKGNNIILKIPVIKEIALYRSLLTEYPNSVYNVKGFLVYSTKNPVLWKSDLNWIQKKFTKIKLYAFPGTHFFPLENPESTANIINRCIYNI